jgi:hypothetical protein
MTNYTVYEGESVTEELQNNPNIIIGDTITYSPNNQQGMEKYEVIAGEDGAKTLRLIDSYDLMMMKYDEENSRKRGRSPTDYASDTDDTDDTVIEPLEKKSKIGGRKSHRRKSHRRKSHCRKSHRRKSHRRKSYRGKSH